VRELAHQLFLQLVGLTESNIEVGERNVLSDELARIISDGLDHTEKFDCELEGNFTDDPYFTSAQWEMRNKRDHKCWREVLAMTRDEKLPGKEMMEAQMKQWKADASAAHIRAIWNGLTS